MGILFAILLDFNTVFSCAHREPIRTSLEVEMYNDTSEQEKRLNDYFMCLRRGDWNEHTADDIYWLYQCVEAEEGINNHRAKYLAACCVLNRVRLGYGNTITDVIFAKNQFEVVKNGRINRVTPSLDTIKACNEALDNCEEWVIAFAQGNLHRSWATVCEVHNGEYYYKSK